MGDRTNLGPCNEKVGHYSEVKEEMLKEEMGKNAFVRWLISEHDGAETFSMRLFRLGIGGFINKHFHPWEHEIYVIKGELKIRIGSRWYRVSDGYYIYIPPNVEHEYINVGSSDAYFICVIPNKPTTKKRLRSC